ncbi:MAG: MBL fold metallo-hydrolase [Paracoccaceae bacterium]
MTADLSTLRLMEPAPGVLAWYDGRIPGHRWSSEPNWVDHGALSLGIATYAVFDGAEAIVYDTHVSVPHAERIRADLAACGVTRFTVVLSHWHLDHVAGTAAFADCPVIANTRTAAHLAAHRTAVEAGTLQGPPAIAPLILPTETFDGSKSLRVGTRTAELLSFDIHSDDATVLWLPDTGLLLAGDTLEDTVTFVSEPDHIRRHRTDLDRLATLRPTRILPDHGDPGRIATGGYGPALIAATARYTDWLIALQSDPSRASDDFRTLLASDLDAGTLVWEEGYEGIHAENIARVVKSAGTR